MKVVHFTPREEDAFGLCYDSQTRNLRPLQVSVDRRGATLFEINEAGLKGDAIHPQRSAYAKIAAFVYDGIQDLLDGGG